MSTVSGRVAEALDTADFWLLVRRFAVAPAGEKREGAKEAVLHHIERALKEEGTNE